MTKPTDMTPEQVEATHRERAEAYRAEADSITRKSPGGGGCLRVMADSEDAMADCVQRMRAAAVAVLPHIVNVHGPGDTAYIDRKRDELIASLGMTAQDSLLADFDANYDHYLSLAREYVRQHPDHPLADCADDDTDAWNETEVNDWRKADDYKPD